MDKKGEKQLYVCTNISTRQKYMDKQGQKQL